MHRGEQQDDEPDDGRAHHGGEDALEVNAGLLRVAVGDQPSLELLHGAILLALDGEDEMTMHDIRRAWH